MPQFAAFPELKQYPGSCNIHLEKDKAMPSFDFGAMTSSSALAHYFIKEAIETQNPAGNPRQYAFDGLSAYYYQDGARSTDMTFTDVVQGACIVEGPPITAGTGGSPNIGVKKLLVSFGSSSLETTRLRTLTADDGGGPPNPTQWTAAVAPGTTIASMFKIIAVGSDFYAATGSGATTTNLGKTVLGEYRVAKCVAGNDPTLAASWSNIQPVGTPEWPINDMAPLFDSFVVSKGDGLYYWNDRTKRFQNALARVRFLPHALNGKGTTAGENCVWYPMADGRLFQFDGNVAKEQTPTKSIVVPRDVGQSRITAIADRGDVVAVRSEPFYTSVIGPRASAALGMKVIRVTGASPTAVDITAGVTDGSLATPVIDNMGTMNSTQTAWGANATDRLYVGCTQPIEAVIVRVTRNPNSNVNSFTSPQYSDGAAGWPSLGTIRDGSILQSSVASSNAKSLALTGYPPGASEAILGWTSIQAYDLMTLESVAFGGGVGTVGPLYWVRFSPTNTTAFTATTTIDEIDVVPARGGLPNSGLLTTTTNFTHRDNANCLGRVSIGRRVGAGTIEWENTYSLDDGGGVWAMAWTTARSGTMTNGGQPLLLWGRYQQSHIAESITRDPSRTLYPKLVQIDTSHPAPRLAFRKLVMGDPSKRTKVNKVVVETQFVQPTDQMAVYGWFDYGNSKPYLMNLSYGSTMEASWPPGTEIPTGREFNFDIVFSDASQSDPTAPYISRVIIDYDDVGGEYEFPRDPAFATPEAV